MVRHWTSRMNFRPVATALFVLVFPPCAVAQAPELAAIARASGAPLIVFPHGAPWALEEVARATHADVIGVDWRTDPAEAVAQRVGDVAGENGARGGERGAHPADDRPHVVDRLRRVGAHRGVEGHELGELLAEHRHDDLEGGVAHAVTLGPEGERAVRRRGSR